MSEWRTTTVDGLGTLFDGPHATPSRIGRGPYFLNIASLDAGRLELSNSDHVSEEDFVRWTKRVTPRHGDLLFSYETRLGQAALMPAGVRACLGRRMALLRPNPDIIDPRFLLYTYLGPSMQQTIKLNTVHGATVNRIPLNRMGRWEVAIPELPEQKAIGEVLGALDDKITANLNLAAAQRSMARAIWSARCLGSETVPLGALVVPGLSGVWGEDSASGVAPIEVLAFRGRDIEDLLVGRPLAVPHRWISATQTTRRIAHDAMEIWTAGSGTLGPTTLVTPQLREEFSMPLMYSNFVRRLIAIEGASAHLASAWFALWDEWEAGNFEQYRTGTAMPNLDVGALLSGVQVPLLEGEARAEVGAWADILLRRDIEAENRTLVALRNALLPELVSGRVRVRDAEAAASAAGV